MLTCRLATASVSQTNAMARRGRRSQCEASRTISKDKEVRLAAHNRSYRFLIQSRLVFIPLTLVSTKVVL